VQPCGELRCSAAGFKIFALCDCVSAINVKYKFVFAVLDDIANG
jgi:hypothetical protein